MKPLERHDTQEDAIIRGVIENLEYDQPPPPNFVWAAGIIVRKLAEHPDKSVLIEACNFVHAHLGYPHAYRLEGEELTAFERVLKALEDDGRIHFCNGDGCYRAYYDLEHTADCCNICERTYCVDCACNHDDECGEDDERVTWSLPLISAPKKSCFKKRRFTPKVQPHLVVLKKKEQKN